MKKYIQSAVKPIGDEDIETLKDLVQNPDCAEQAIPHLLKSTNQYDRLEAAKSPNAAPELLTQMANDRSNKVRIAVAGNPNTPPEVLRKIRETHSYVDNSHCPVDGRFVVALLKNNSTPIDYRKKLIDMAYFGNPYVSWADSEYYRDYYGDPILAIIKDSQAPIEIIKYILQIETKYSSKILKTALKRIYGE